MLYPKLALVFRILMLILIGETGIRLGNVQRPISIFSRPHQAPYSFHISHQHPYPAVLHSLYSIQLHQLQPSLLVALLLSTFGWLIHSFDPSPVIIVFTFFSKAETPIKLISVRAITNTPLLCDGNRLQPADIPQSYLSTSNLIQGH